MNRRTKPGGFANLLKIQRGPGGRALCRQCGQEVPKGRITFCGPVCIDAWKMLTDPGYVAEMLFRRDHGVCNACGVDCTEIKTLPVNAIIRQKIAIEFFGSCARGRVRFWDADHIVPVQHGGGLCGLDNFQTLCCCCHKRKTSQQKKTTRRKGKNNGKLH